MSLLFLICANVFAVAKKPHTHSEHRKRIDKKILRDPFNFPVKKSNKKIDKPVAVKNTDDMQRIKLAGIICSAGKFGAVLEIENQAETVFVNDVINGFKILRISSNYVVLSKNKSTKKIFIE